MGKYSQYSSGRYMKIRCDDIVSGTFIERSDRFITGYKHSVKMSSDKRFIIKIKGLLDKKIDLQWEWIE